MTYFKIVNTDNFGGDYPDESFLATVYSKGRTSPCTYSREEDAKKVADILNGPANERSPRARYWKVVASDYVLQPGFEP